MGSEMCIRDRPSSWGLGWTLFILSFAFTAVIIILIAINFPYRMQKLLRPGHVRPADRMDHVDEEFAASRTPDTIAASAGEKEDVS